MKFSVINSGSAIQYWLLACIRVLSLSSADLIYAVVSFVLTQSFLMITAADSTANNKNKETGLAE